MTTASRGAVAAHVVQSCPSSRPAWMVTCMATVERWASSSGYEYRRVDDATFLGLVPDWYRAKSALAIQPVTDLARIEVALRSLRAGAETVVWMDADLLVFGEGLTLPSQVGVAFAREVWLDLDRATGSPYCVERVNNSVLVASDLARLQNYRESCLRIAAENPGPLGKALVSTEYLTDLYRRWPFPLVRHVGNFSPPVMHAILGGERDVLDYYRARLGEPLRAANLCASFENKDYFGLCNATGVYERVADLLLTSGGGLLS